MKLLLIDGSAILYRSFYGLAKLQTSYGQPTQAILGFLKSLKKIIQQFAPDFVVVAWDSPISARKIIYDQYKNNRQKTPGELLSQKTLLEEILTKTGVVQLTIESAEADDIIFTLSNLFLHQKINSLEESVIIASPDKDLLQLVNTQIKVFDPLKNQLFDIAAVTTHFGFGPEKVAFYHSLLGDASDNIPGISGIGKTTAKNLVLDFSSLEELYQKLSQTAPVIRKKLEAGQGDAFLSKELFALKSIILQKDFSNFDFELSKTQNLNWNAAKDLLSKLELKSLLPEKASEKTDKETNVAIENAYNLENKAIAELSIIIIKDLEALKKLITQIKKTKMFTFDLETTGLSWTCDKIVGIALCIIQEECFYIPLEHQEFNLPSDLLAETIVLLREIFEDPTILKISHNGKFDNHFLASNFEIYAQGKAFDTAIAARLCLPEWISVGLKNLSLTELGLQRKGITDLLKNHAALNMSFVPVSDAAKYACLDVSQTTQLYKIFEKRLTQNPELRANFEKIEMPLAQILLQMEEYGIVFDKSKAAGIYDLVEKELQLTKDKIFAFLSTLNDTQMPKSINLNSSSQLQTLLFDVLKLPRGKKLKGGKSSTNVNVLTELASIHPIAGLILEYRKLYKIKSTYLEGLLEHVKPSTSLPKSQGIIHTDYSQIIVSTGRLSSFEPNLQNIPQPINNLNIRSCFIPRHGKSFLSADYSQIELRVLAHFTNDENLITAFNSSFDIHNKTACTIFAKNPESVTAEERTLAKKINFSILYGATAFSLSKELKISVKAAQEHIQAFFITYPKVAPWMDCVVTQAAMDGFITTYMGRKRWFRNLNDENQFISKGEARAAINAVIQGSAAEIIKMAMIKLSEYLKLTPRLRKAILPATPGLDSISDYALLLQVHDEVLLECPAQISNSMLQKIENLMSSVVSWKIQLPVNLKIGNDWGDLHKISE